VIGDVPALGAARIDDIAYGNIGAFHELPLVAVDGRGRSC
jgi:hypothetical protein